MNPSYNDRELIQIMDAAWADASRRAGAHLACRPGCTQCCHGPFPINALDAARLREGMAALAHSNPALAQAVESRARAWLAQNGPGFPGDLQSGILSDTDEARERFDDFANEAPCPALDPATGRCDLYASRPMTCRVFGPPVRMETGALGCCELCFTTAAPEQIAACEMPVPHDLEEDLLAAIGDPRETVVAFALLTPPQH